MSWQSLRTSLLLICALGVLTVGMTPAQAAAPNRVVSAAPRTAAVGTGAGNLSREVFGFALGSSLSDPTVGYPSWNFDLLSTVAYFGLHVLWDGTFQNDSGLAVWNSSQLTDMVKVAHAHGTKVLLTIINGDARGTYPNAMCDGLLYSATTVTHTVAEVKAKGVDGVNVDYEGVNQACNTSDPSWARHHLTTFVQSLRAALGTTYALSVDTYSGAAGDPIGFFDVPGLGPSVDYVFVMTYDMEYSNYYRAPTSCGHFCLGPTSPLTTYYYNDTNVLAQYSAAVTPAKVIFGVPYYGRKACVASTTVEYQHPVGAVTADTYLSASGEATDPSVRPGSYVAHRDANDGMGQERWDTWYSNTYKCTRLLFWDDAASLSMKYDLANRAGIRGVGIWTLNYGGAAPELWSTLASRFGGWKASYDMTKAPVGWGAGQTQTFPVTVTNTGTQVWPATGTYPVDLNLHFARSAGGAVNHSAWLTSQTFGLPHDLAPGQNVTMNVTVTAPAAGAVVLEAEMIKQRQFWFLQWQPVSVGISSWAAAFDMTKVPTKWVAGVSQTFPVTVTNAGNTSWPAAGHSRVDLDLHFTTRAGGSSKAAYWLSSAIFSLPADLAPRTAVTLNVTLAAPRTGTMLLEAEMIKEHEFWFQQWAPVNVVVSAATWSASYSLRKTPRTWTALHTQTFDVTLNNLGNQTWPAAGTNRVDLDFHFTSRTGGGVMHNYWLTNQAFSLPADVAPGGTVTLTVTVTAPANVGTMFLEAEMIKEHQFWFTQTSAVTVIAAPVGWSASYNVTEVPTSWSVGKSQTFALTVTNDGTQTWPSTGSTRVDLDLHFATSAGGAANLVNWVYSKAFVIGKDVAPGQSVAVAVTIDSPKAGSLVLEVEMIKEHQFWFIQSTPVSVTVAA